MNNTVRALICLVASCSMVSLAQEHSVDPAIQRPKAPGKSVAPQIDAQYGKLPLSFEPNQGQSDPSVRFLSRGQGYSLFLTDSAAVLSLVKGGGSDRRPHQLDMLAKNHPPTAKPVKTDIVRMELAGASPGLRVNGADQLTGNANYFIGNNPAKWHSNVPTYAKVKYSGVYPGVDLVYYGNQGRLEYDFVIAPGAKPKSVRLHFAGASKLTLNRDGDLTVAAKYGEIAFRKPVIYQTKGGQRTPVEGRFALLANNTVGFTLSDYDRSRELIIDPVLAYSTYLGGSGGAAPNAMAVDGAGYLYVAGTTASPHFPFSNGAYQPLVYPQGVAFITKLNPAGSALVWSAYIGASYAFTPVGMAVDSSGSVYLTGYGGGGDFPITPAAYQSTFGNSAVVKLDHSGSSLAYSTYFGGGSTYSQALALDASGDVYITGYTFDDIPVTSGAFQAVKGDAITAFVTKFNPTGSNLVYSTYLGGSGSAYTDSDSGEGIAVDAANHAYVAGYTTTFNFPTTLGALQTTSHAPGLSQAFIAKFNSDGSNLLYSTLLGGSGFQNALGDSAKAIAIDPSGNAYVMGKAYSADFPVTPNAFLRQNTSYYGGRFVSKLNAAGSALVYSTFLEGPATGYYQDYLGNVAVDAAGHAFVTGGTSDALYPVTPGAFQAANNAAAIAGPNAFVTELNLTGTALDYSTFLGGSGISYQIYIYESGFETVAVGDYGVAVALDRLGNPYIAGAAGSTDLPITEGAFQKQNNAAGQDPTTGNEVNSFLAKFALVGGTTTSLSSNNSSPDVGDGILFTAQVDPVSGMGIPSGIVNFLVDGVPQLKVDLDGEGRATYSTRSLSVGPHAVTASYYGDEANYSSSSGTLTQTITGQVATPTFVTLGGTYTDSGGNFAVSIETATPGAAIHYTTDTTTPSSTSPLYTGPIPVSSTTTVKAIATETGDSNSDVATAVFTIVPKAILTRTTLIASANPVEAGQPVTFTATVVPVSGPVPTGSVVFKHGSTVMATIPLTGGVAAFQTSDLDAGSHTITATYTGSATNSLSGQTLNLMVNP